ncbi:hypothetical protein CA13_09270 [Planctomycetes bacterium CA13]|uniref:Uncharacterized protein n=1 Tax=Novipirellula herctigrandis TaxID=2527986 RepID=A0A5C5YYF8_9BACT|nr:hypothetical protein CA13_09270 [Planctomycetes bacterium CA13]
MSLHPVIAENTARFAQWRDDSFMGTLHESHHWNHAKFGALEDAILQLAGNKHDDTTIAALFQIFDYLMLLFGCHFDPSDDFKFKNLTIEQICDYRERVQVAFSAYFYRTTNRNDSSTTTAG